MRSRNEIKPNQKIKCKAAESFQIYYLHRKESEGGGLAMGIDKEIESTLVMEGDDDLEVLVVQAVLGAVSVKIIAAYGPQENALKEKKEKFWEFLEQEANKAEVDDQGLIIQMDGNLHGGPELVKNDPNKQNKNGAFFKQLLVRTPSLFVANNMDMCEGLITRQRKVKDKTEKAILDFFVMNEKMRCFLTKVIIDENREYCLSNFSQVKKNRRVIETDHNLMFADLDISVPKRKPERVELFNFRNEECQKIFTKETNSNTSLVECFQNNLPFQTQSTNWLKTFNTILHKCFRKIRVVQNNKKQSKNELLIKERIQLKKDCQVLSISEEMKLKIEERICEIEMDIGNEIAEEYKKEIDKTLKEFGGDDKNLCGSGRQKLWKLLKKKFPKCSLQNPMGKKDKYGNLITNHEELKKLYLETYVHRLRNRPMKSEYEEIKKLKEELFELKMNLASCNKSAPWSMDDLNLVLKQLKNGKARDPNGWVNDLFGSEVAGSQLKLSMLMFFNKMKTENYIPEFIRKADIATIYKGKGEKCNLENDRGIFLVTTFRSILMRLIYVDKY